MFTIAFIHPPIYHFSEVVSIRRVYDVSRIEHLFALRVRATNGGKNHSVAAWSRTGPAKGFLKICQPSEMFMQFPCFEFVVSWPDVQSFGKCVPRDCGDSEVVVSAQRDQSSET